MTLDALFQKQREEPKQKGPRADSEDMFGSQPRKANVAADGLRFHIKYRDDKGGISLRNVKVTSFAIKQGISHLDAYGFGGNNRKPSPPNPLSTRENWF